jgi:hypothetical protein
MDTIVNIWETGYKQLFGVSENYYDENSVLNMPTTLLNNITTSVSDVFSSISSMTFGGEPAKKSGKMMALKSTTSTVTIPKFLSSDDNGNLSMFDLDKHTTENDFSAVSLSSLKGDIKVAAGAQLCIGSTCISEADLKQLGYDGASHENVITYKPSEIFNKLAMKTPGRKYTRYFYRTWLPESQRAGVPLIEGNIVTEIPAGQDGFIKQTIYDTSNTVPNVACRYSKTSLKNIANDDNWGPFSIIGTPFIHGSSGLLMQNWKLIDNGGLRFHHDADQNIVSSKTGYDAVSQKFLMGPDGKGWEKASGYYSDKFATLATKAEAIKTGDKVTMYDSYAAGNIKMAGGYVAAPSGTKNYDLTGSNALQINKV